MGKPEIEFTEVEAFPWRQAEGYPEGAMDRVLSCDEQTGACSRMLRLPPGTQSSERLAHDFWEEVYILEGSITDLTEGRTFTSGMYACRPPGMKHGPYRTDTGCLTIEVRYYQ